MTLSLVDECQYDGAFTFIYSPREGTPAARMQDNVPVEVKSRRLQQLNEKIAFYAHRNNEPYLGRIVTVLVDGPSKKTIKFTAATARRTSWSTSPQSMPNRVISFKSGLPKFIPGRSMVKRLSSLNRKSLNVLSQNRSRIFLKKIRRGFCFLFSGDGCHRGE